MEKYSDGKKKGEGSFANMPQEVEMKAYPKYPKDSEKELDDTITGIDKSVSQGKSKKSKYVSNQK